ncbi:MAG TPA: glutamate--tRNA ligase [Nitrospirae bacterium]|nr:glutamate--tRNA ligase [Nitrospirota bacterium]
MSNIKVRFAPSPTGHLHIGSARTALFNWLFARSQGGRFVLRIEDTDRERSTDEFIVGIIEGMKWMGLDWDEGPFRQTERIDLHKKHIADLLAAGDAYYCYCSPEELDAHRKQSMKEGKPMRYNRRCRGLTEPVKGVNPVVRFAMPLTGSIVIDDMIKGKVTFNNEELDDLIIARSDGTPTYNLVVVADDVDMGITHVIRGEDHLNNTPKQAHIYRALGCEPPRFAHQSLILGPDKGKMSKRHGATSVLDYREAGYLPSALVNYLIRLGWSHGDQEVFTRDELIEYFSLDKVGTSASIYDKDKLQWLNAEHIKMTPPEEMLKHLTPYLVKEGLVEEGWAPEPAWFKKALSTLAERAKDLNELASSMRYYIAETVEFEEKAKKKFLKPETKELFEEAVKELASIEEFTADRIEESFKAICDQREIGLGKLAQPVRVALTGGTASPGIFDVLEIVGRERTLLRLNKASEACE